MAFGPITVGDTGAPFVADLLDDSGTSLLSAGLPASAISMTMVSGDTIPATVKTCAGAWTIDNAVTGQCHYVFQANDVNQAGTWECTITLTLASGPFHLDPVQLIIRKAPGSY